MIASPGETIETILSGRLALSRACCIRRQLLIHECSDIIIGRRSSCPSACMEIRRAIQMLAIINGFDHVVLLGTKGDVGALPGSQRGCESAGTEAGRDRGHLSAWRSDALQGPTEIRKAAG